jgi:hypothetical protein
MPDVEQQNSVFSLPVLALVSSFLAIFLFCSFGMKCLFSAIVFWKYVFFDLTRAYPKRLP